MNYKEHMPKAPRALSERGLQSLQVKDETKNRQFKYDISNIGDIKTV